MVILSTDRVKASVDSPAGMSSSLPTSTPVKLAFYCDSSSHRDSRYMVVGGIAVQTARYTALCAAVQAIKDAAPIRSEMKWADYRGGERTAAYEGLVRLFFSLIAQNQIHFHALIAEFGAFSHKAFEGGTPEKSVNRMYYQLLTHRLCKQYGSRCELFIYPDYGNDSADLARFHGHINHAANLRYGVPHSIVTIEPRDSSQCNVLQMADVLLGGIAYVCNARNRDGSSAGPKADLAEYILRRSGRKTWLFTTAKSQHRLTTWCFRHQSWGMAPRGTRRFVRHG